jgi:hypothetical protein
MAAFHESRQEDAKAYLIREIINSGGSLDNLEDVLPILDKMSQFKMSQEIK